MNTRRLDIRAMAKALGSTVCIMLAVVFSPCDALSQVTDCSEFKGDTASAKIIKCIASIPATGGTADARALFGNQTLSADVFSGVTKPITLLLGAGNYTVSVQQVMNCVGCTIVGTAGIAQGQTLSANPATVLTKSGNFDTIWMKGNNTSIRDVLIRGGSGGDGILITGTQVVVQDVAVRNQPQDGIRIGQKVSSGVGDGNTNANIWRLRNVGLEKNGRDGLHIEDAFDRVDASQGLAEGVHSQYNGRDGIYTKGIKGVLNELIDSAFFGVMSSCNTGQGIHLDAGTSGFTFWFPYAEFNKTNTCSTFVQTGPDILLEANTFRNVIFGIRAGARAYPTGGAAGPVGKTDAVTDNGTGNFILTRINKDCCKNVPELEGFYLASTLGISKVVLQDAAAGLDHYWTIRQNTASNNLELVPVDSGSRVELIGNNSEFRVYGDTAGRSALRIVHNGSNAYLYNSADQLLALGQNNMDRWYVDIAATNGTLRPAADNRSDLCSASSRCRSLYVATSIVNNGTTTTGQLRTTNPCASTTGACGAAASGFVTIAAGATTRTINTSAMTANGVVFIQEDSSLGSALGVTCNTTTGRTYTVTTRTAGTSFVVAASAPPAANPACLSYTIISNP
jgi:hypothetical protein